MARMCQQKKRIFSFLDTEEGMSEEWMSQEPCNCVNMIMERVVTELDVEQKIVKSVDIKLAAIEIIEHNFTEPDSA